MRLVLEQADYSCVLHDSRISGRRERQMATQVIQSCGIAQDAQDRSSDSICRNRSCSFWTTRECYQRSKATSFQLKMCTSTMRRRRRSRGFSHRLSRILHCILADAHASKGHLGWFNQHLKNCVAAAKATTRGRRRINWRLTNLSLRLRSKVRRHWCPVPTLRGRRTPVLEQVD